MGYTSCVKTAISLPDDMARRFDEAARRRGMSRSEFYRMAAERYLEHLESDDVTARVDAAIAVAGQPGADGDVWRRAAGEVIARGEW